MGCGGVMLRCSLCFQSVQLSSHLPPYTNRIMLTFSQQKNNRLGKSVRVLNGTFVDLMLMKMMENKLLFWE